MQNGRKTKFKTGSERGPAWPKLYSEGTSAFARGFGETAFVSSLHSKAKAGAGDRIRTDDSHVGNVTLYH